MPSLHHANTGHKIKSWFVPGRVSVDLEGMKMSKSFLTKEEQGLFAEYDVTIGCSAGSFCICANLTFKMPVYL